MKVGNAQQLDIHLSTICCIFIYVFHLYFCLLYLATVAVMSGGKGLSSYAHNRFSLSLFYSVGLSFTNASYWGIYAFIFFTVIAALSTLLYDAFVKCKKRNEKNETVVVA